MYNVTIYKQAEEGKLTKINYASTNKYLYAIVYANAASTKDGVVAICVSESDGKTVYQRLMPPVCVDIDAIYNTEEEVDPELRPPEIPKW